jgi:predicted ATPase/class 3 adenylate cyclase
MISAVRPELPTGTVTFVFTDVEGSTSLLNELGAEAYAKALADHRSVIRKACTENGGVEVDTQGDAFFFAFTTASGALAAASSFTETLAANGPIRVRAGIHTGTPLVGEEGYIGHDVHRAARIAAAGHGGQVLVSASTAALLDTELTDLGKHRFKDLRAPERVFQLGDAKFPSLKSLYRTNLPIPATAFLGRQREIAEVVELLHRDDGRLVNLTGPGGTGKTRLVLEAAAAAADHFPDGVWWVALAPLRDGSLLAATVAQALEVDEHPERTVTDSVVHSLVDKQTLLIIDNCEHLLDAVAEFVRELVDACPRLVVACSSRERLGLRAERVFPVPPMTGSEAEMLFVERARAVEPGFVSDEDVPAICAELDELPLAIELAAARVRSLSTAALRERLAERLPLLSSRERDRDDRQRTLEATIAWSYDLLDSDERRALRALSVFAGGSTLEAAEVANADLELVESLLDKSLLRHRIDEAHQDRYWLLETIREYAAARLEEHGEAEIVRARHRDHFCELARALAGDQLVALPANVARYKADRGNFRVIFSEALARNDGAVAIPLVASLVGVWLSAGETLDSYSPARAALALPGADDHDRDWAHDRAGVLADELGRWDEAQQLYGQAYESAVRRGDTLLACEASRHHSSMFLRMSRYELAAEWAQRSVDLARELGSDEAEERSLYTQVEAMATAAIDRDDPDTAVLERCLAILRELEPRSIAHGNEWRTREAFSQILFPLRRYAEALPHAQAVLRHFGPSSYRSPYQFMLIGFILGGLNHYRTAVMLVSAGRRDNAEQGLADFQDYDKRDLRRFEANAREALGDGAYDAAVHAGEALSVEEAAELALMPPSTKAIPAAVMNNPTGSR